MHKKRNKNLIKSYRPISLLPIFSKIYERLIFKSQSVFLPGDSCISQLLSITHEIHKSFDCNPPLDARGTFLDIYEPFDKVWYEGLIFKLETYRMNG